jgi:aminoglycoside 3-N-acetyltransferase
VKRTSPAELLAVLARLQLPRNHVYMVHSSLLKFGLVDGGLPAVMACLWQTVGPKATLLMPAFSFSFGQSRRWDYHASRAETGALCEHFRKLPQTWRTLHPFHSLVVCGPQAQAFTACHQASSFGAGSPFEQLVEHEAMNIGLGTEFVGGATFLHHAEELARVPYRVHKRFPGEVVDAHGQRLNRTFEMYVRRVDGCHEYQNQWAPVWDDLREQDLVRCEQLHGAKVFAMPIKACHDWFLGRLLADPYYCAAEAPMEQPG